MQNMRGKNNFSFIYSYIGQARLDPTIGISGPDYELIWPDMQNFYRHSYYVVDYWFKEMKQGVLISIGLMDKIIIGLSNLIFRTIIKVWK